MFMGNELLNRRTVLRVSGLAIGATMLPVSATGVQARKPNAVFDLDFSDAADAADNTSTSAGWVVDRRAPDSWTTDAGRLCINVDETGPVAPDFSRYQGKKYQDVDETYWNAGTGSRLSYRFYIDPAWETDGESQASGMWLVLGDAEGNINAYPILEYQDSDASDTDDAKFRAFVYETDENGDFETAKWVDIPLSKKLGIDPDEGGWVDLEAQLQQTSDGAAVKWRVNNKLVLDERNYNAFAPSTQFLEFIINSENFGNDATYYYDDMVLSTPGAASD